MTTTPWIACDITISKKAPAETTAAKIRYRAATPSLAHAAKTDAMNIPKKAEAKSGLPKRPKIFPYGLFQGRKSPKIKTHPQSITFTIPANCKAKIILLKFDFFCIPSNPKAKKLNNTYAKKAVFRPYAPYKFCATGAAL